MVSAPICIYNNWSSYDELSDGIELTEELALREFDEVVRLKRAGVRLDAYLMDAFWYAPEGGYRTWRKPHWPQGPDRWLARCQEHGLKPGLWLSSNTFCKLEPIPVWEDSLNETRSAACFFCGGFWPDLLEALDRWYRRGVRLYKFDFLDLSALRPGKRLSPDEAIRQNVLAFTDGLKSFRAEHPEVILLGYNGFALECAGESLVGRWLEAFDSLYSGDPAPSDVPAVHFFRSVDIYSDLTTQAYQGHGFPLHRIDNCGFMGGPTGTCYWRKDAGWKGMLLLSLARGGWMNCYHGALEQYDDEHAAWFAKAQSMLLPLQQRGISTFGGAGAEEEPYGFLAQSDSGALATVMNPSQSVARIELPVSGGQVLFQDAGFPVQVEGTAVTLGPSQMAVIGAGRYASAKYDLGQQADFAVPHEIRPLAADFTSRAGGAAATVTPEREGWALRIIGRQRGADGRPRRVWPQHHAEAAHMGELLRLRAEQNGHPLPVALDYDRRIWSGLSWAAGEIAADSYDPAQPVTVWFESADAEARLSCELYLVRYAGSGGRG